MRTGFGSRRTGLLVAAVVVGMLAWVGGGGGCTSEGKLADRSDLSGGLWTIKVTSPAFDSGGEIPQKYTQQGQNVSPPLKWSLGPGGVKSWAVVVQDINSGGSRPATHWVVYNIPPETTQLDEGAAAGGNLTQGKNYKGETGYAGPDPKHSETHKYYFQVFALDTKLDVPAGADAPAIRQALTHQQGHVLSKGEMWASYTGQ